MWLQITQSLHLKMAAHGPFYTWTHAAATHPDLLLCLSVMLVWLPSTLLAAVLVPVAPCQAPIGWFADVGLSSTDSALIRTVTASVFGPPLLSHVGLLF